MICVYKVTNPEGQIYIGSTNNFKKRIYYYRSVSCRNQKKIVASFKKYGFENHVFEPIEECSLDNLYERENYWGFFFDVLGENGLNSFLPLCGKEGVGISQDTRKKMSESKMGEKNYFYKRKHTKETRCKISKAHLGKKHSDEHKRKVSLNNARHKSKLVLDLDTGIYYNSAKEASYHKGLVHSTLRSKLNGRSPNGVKYNLIYV
jgi:group I intron endonuclease